MKVGQTARNRSLGSNARPASRLFAALTVQLGQIISPPAIQPATCGRRLRSKQLPISAVMDSLATAPRQSAGIQSP